MGLHFRTEMSSVSANSCYISEWQRCLMCRQQAELGAGAALSAELCHQPPAAEGSTQQVHAHYAAAASVFRQLWLEAAVDLH